MWVRVHLDIGTKERRAALPAGRAWWSDPAFPWTTYRHEDGAMAPHPPLPR
jgi:hypothetical protein